MKVLIADGTGSLSATGVAFFSGRGDAVEVAADGSAALRRARAWRPDVVLATVHLDRMDGLALSAALLASAETRGIRILLAGSEEDVFARWRGEHLGVFAYLATPLGPADLERVAVRLAPPEARPHIHRRARHG